MIRRNQVVLYIFGQLPINDGQTPVVLQYVRIELLQDFRCRSDRQDFSGFGQAVQVIVYRAYIRNSPAVEPVARRRNSRPGF